MLRNFLWVYFGAKLALLAVNSAAGADTVKLVNRPEFRQVELRGMHAGLLTFRGLSSQIIRKPLNEVAWVHVSGRPALNAAEDAAADHDWPAAIEGYQLALAENPPRRLRTFIRHRLFRAYDHAGRFDQAVHIWALLLNVPGELATGYIPVHPGPPGSTTNQAALARLDAALQTAVTPAAHRQLRAMRLQLMIYEGVTDLPPAPGTTPKSTPASAPGASQPTGPLGILPTAEPSEQPDATDDLILKDPPLLARAIDCALEQGQADRAARLLERTTPYLPPETNPRWQLLEARVLLATGSAARAADRLLALADETTDGELRSAALYYCAVAHEQLQRRDVSRDLLRRVLADPTTSDEIRRQAIVARTRLSRDPQQRPTSSAPAP